LGGFNQGIVVTPFFHACQYFCISNYLTSYSDDVPFIIQLHRRCPVRTEAEAVDPACRFVCSVPVNAGAPGRAEPLCIDLELSASDQHGYLLLEYLFCNFSNPTLRRQKVKHSYFPRERLL